MKIDKHLRIELHMTRYRYFCIRMRNLASWKIAVFPVWNCSVSKKYQAFRSWTSSVRGRNLVFCICRYYRFL